MRPYYQDDTVTLYHGSFEDVLPALDTQFDLCVADPPYGQTSLGWDVWPGGWPAFIAAYTSSLWCFGTTRMFLERRDEFQKWQLSQDIVWDKSRPTTVVTDRFRRRHEIVLDVPEARDGPVVHEQPVAVAERVAVGLLDRRPGGGPPRRGRRGGPKWSPAVRTCQGR